MTAAGTPQRSEADEYKPYDQFILFGDSITQMACDHEYGGTWHPALQGGETVTLSFREDYSVDLDANRYLQPTVANWM